MKVTYLVPIIYSYVVPLQDLVPFTQFKKRKKHPWRSVTFSKVKVTLLHGCFSRFSNCAHGAKSRNAQHMLSGLNIFTILQYF